MLKPQFEFIKDRGEDDKTVLINDDEKKLLGVDTADELFSFFFYFCLIQNTS